MIINHLLLNIETDKVKVAKTRNGDLSVYRDITICFYRKEVSRNERKRTIDGSETGSSLPSDMFGETFTDIKKKLSSYPTKVSNTEGLRLLGHIIAHYQLK